ncbi:hypothetical protein GDO81_004271 [Engystomops pustulosus]|uniref:Uncharacterized protein n=1 Tax=Engystomops pustulosus TaxID=76066 RepID=A0AAV6ZRB7_ENGPU|nr:hypothetical protein GDO81_004271 [Engystomops pustulosus]
MESNQNIKLVVHQILLPSYRSESWTSSYTLHGSLVLFNLAGLPEFHQMCTSTFNLGLNQDLWLLNVKFTMSTSTYCQCRSVGLKIVEYFQYRRCFW